MFFLILLGRGCSEKDCAGFCRDLREFSRAVAGAGLAGRSDDRVDRRHGRCIPDGPPSAPRLAREPRATRVSVARAVTLTVAIHSVPIGRWRRMSTTLRPIGRALTVRLHSVSSGVRAGISTPGIGMRLARVSLLTVGIHSAASGFRRGISTSDPAHFVDPPRTFTVRIHRVESEFVRRISTPEHPCCVIAVSPSPLICTGIRLAAAAVVHARNCIAFQPSDHPHRRKPQRFEWLEGPDIHMGARSPIDRRCAFRRAPTTGNPYRTRLFTRSGLDAHPRNTQCRESFRRPDIHTAACAAPRLQARGRARPEQRFARHRQPTGRILAGRTPIPKSRSPLNCMARRVA